MRVLENTVVALLKERPFYGHLILAFRRRAVSGAPLGATIANGVPTLCVDPGALFAYSPAERVALIEHVLKHILHLHPARAKGRHGRDWDIACDLAINPSIENLPANAVLPEDAGLDEGLAAEEYYRLLRRDFDTGNLEGEGLGNATQDTGGATGAGDSSGPDTATGLETVDDHRVWEEAQSTPLRLAEEVVRTMVRDAHRKSHGEIPGDVRSIVEGWLVPPAIPWRQVLSQFVASAGRVGRRSTWQREHRRFAHETPGVRKRRRLNLLVAVDSSDSTNEAPLREAFARELVRIARGRDSLITVLYTGSRLQKVEAFSTAPSSVDVYLGGGFTDLRPPFEYAATMTPPPAALIYLTDGFGPAPETMILPTLWVLTPDGRKPAEWGVELRLDP